MSQNSSPEVVLRGDVQTEDVAAFAKAHGLAPVAARLLLARGVTADQLQAFMAPTLRQLRDPSTMAGFPQAMSLLETAVTEGWRVAVFGDYDVDGVTSATMVSTFLEALGVDVVVQVAQRARGYGLGLDDCAEFVGASVQLLVVCDCGTSDIEALTFMRERGVNTIVLDHHQAPEVMPPCDALINPHQPGCEYPFKQLCTGGVAFFICAALRARLGHTGHQNLPDVLDWLDLAAMATVCDMMELRDENRVLVTAGLERMRERLRPGIRSMLLVAGAPLDELSEDTFGFKLGPRINSPGRLGSATPSLELLRERSPAKTRDRAKVVEELNTKRRAAKETTVAEALALASTAPDGEAAIVVASSAWLPGVVGIAANDVAEAYRRPALVLATNPDTGKASGSARTYGKVDVHAALSACEDILDRFGGHTAAAGVSLSTERIPELCARFTAAVADQLEVIDHSDVEVVDDVVPLGTITEAFIDSMRSLAPYGVGFDRPRFVTQPVEVTAVRVLKDKHVALTVKDASGKREAIAFGQAHHALETGEKVRLIHTPQVDTWKGNTKVKLHVERIWREQ